MATEQGSFLGVGAALPTLDQTRVWPFVPRVRVGDRVGPGDVIGTTEERPGLEHRILVPPDVSGVVAAIDAGDFNVSQTVCRLEDGTKLRMAQRWPVRIPRPVSRWLGGDRPFVTGQRVFDLLFPVAEGGAVAVPGGSAPARP
ncbi:MAG: hypothetical protein R2909_16780 [Gemmatimonadales bacterium]